jgi:DhnA family fructose-bisphosphate aldolase class Ia
METGIVLRKNQFFDTRDNRSVIIALDHGGIAGPVEGIEDPAPVIRACVAGGVDGILTTKGFADASRGEWNRSTGLILRVTGGFTVLGGGFEEEMIMEPESVLAYGASCAAITVKFGHEREGAFIRQASLAIDAFHRLGVPVMIEAMAKGTINKEKFPANDPEGIRMAARMAAEIGAELVKTYYTGSPESFARVTSACPVPVVILGGAKTDSPEGVFQDIAGSLASGGAGIAMGRNIWGFPNLAAMLEAVKGMVHSSWTVKQALERIQDGAH